MDVVYCQASQPEPFQIVSCMGAQAPQPQYQVMLANLLGEHLGVRPSMEISLASEPQFCCAALTKTFLHLDLEKDKAIQCSDWEAWPLSAQQRAYAATDAYVSLRLHQVGTFQDCPSWIIAINRASVP